MAAIAKSFTSNLKSLVSAQTLKDGALVAAGGVGTPIMSGVVQGLLARIKPGLIDPAGALAKGIDLLSAGLLGTVITFVAKNPKTARLVVLGGMAGVMSDIATESVLPAVGLSDYLSLQPGMNDYLALPRRGISDYLTKRQMQMSDWATVTQVAEAGPSYSPDESF